MIWESGSMKTTESYSVLIQFSPESLIQRITYSSFNVGKRAPEESKKLARSLLVGQPQWVSLAVIFQSQLSLQGQQPGGHLDSNITRSAGQCHSVKPLPKSWNCEIINVCYFKSLSLRVMAYTATGNNCMVPWQPVNLGQVINNQIEFKEHILRLERAECFAC